MDRKIVEKKKIKPIIIIILIILIGVLLFIRISNITNDLSLTFLFVIVGILIIGIFVGFLYIPTNIRYTIIAWIKVLFIHLILPLMFFIIILLGALTEIYPPTSYPNGTFEDNINKTFPIMANAMSNAFQRLTMSLYNEGKNRPILWIIIFFIYIIVITFLMKKYAKEEKDYEIKRYKVKMNKI
jgi:hypothetical protein